MTYISGILNKMRTELADSVQYNFYLTNLDKSVAPSELSVNQFLGKKLRVRFMGQINCVHCSRETKKTFSQGYCFPCSQKLAACDMCILKPQNCHYHLGTCREPNWGLQQCFIPHVVYLANSSGLKVGVTRQTQLPTRWIDQGATQALPIILVQSRLQAGLIEELIAEEISDKTDWRKMLRGISEQQDLQAQRNQIFAKFGTSIQKIASKFTFGDIELLTNESIQQFNYPVLEYPAKITSLNFDTNPEIYATLIGIKGQYLLFDQGVINMRKFTGYQVEINY